MPGSRTALGRPLGREALLLAVPILALVGFGFLSLRWEKKAQEEELRARCLALAEPLRRDFFARVAAVDYLRDDAPPGTVDALPVPGTDSESLARFIEGEYQVVLGQAGALSETGLPLRPLAAVRLLRTEEDPIRLEELVQVIAAEPSFITDRLLRDAEERYRQLGLPEPEVLRGWETRLARATRVHGILAGREPEQLLAASESYRWLGTNGDLMLLIRTPDGVALVDKLDMLSAMGTSRASIADALPPGILAANMLRPADGDRMPAVAVSSGSLPVRFVVEDASSWNDLLNRRRGFFVSYLVVAAVLSGIGIVVLLRSVARERELAERKGNLVAAVSHEMRTPVASIRLLAENLSSGAADSGERRASHLQRLLEQSERLSTLVENVLSYSKRVAGRAKWRFAPLDVERLLSDAAAQFEALAESREISLQRSAGEFAAAPEGDAKALGQALANLIDNALKHSPRGGEVSLGAKPDSGRADGWFLWVSDAGPGVPPEEREKVFEAFYRVGPELRRETKGTGLGLALVQQVADAHGGEVLCREADGGGARFELHLPNKILNPEYQKG